MVVVYEVCFGLIHFPSNCSCATTDKLSSNSKTRLDTMVKTNDGFEIAEVDLRLRGPGDIMGTQQSGILNLKIADIIKDNDILQSARHYAKKILQDDPSLSFIDNEAILNTYKSLTKYKNIWNYIS